MKYSCLFIALTIACAVSVKTGEQSTMTLESTINKLNQSPWGQVASSFLELQMEVQSPIGDLVQAFQDFLRDNAFKMEINQKDFSIQLAEHNKWEMDLRDLIAHNEMVIATSTSSLDNILYPLKAQLEEAITRDRALDAATVGEMGVATVERAAMTSANALFVEECEDAIAAIDECLALLDSLNSGGASLIQMTKVTRSFKKVGDKLKNTRFSSIIKALLKLSDFADPAMLAKVKGRFIEVRESLVNDIANSIADEADQLAAFNAFMQVCQETLDQARARVAANTAALEQCDLDIETTIATRETATADLAQAETDLATEMARWAGVVATFEQLFAELTNEAEAINEVIDLVASVEVSEETLDRMNQ